MVTFDLRDPFLVENFKAARELQKSGMFSDEQIQDLYLKQVEKDSVNPELIREVTP